MVKDDQNPGVPGQGGKDGRPRGVGLGTVAAAALTAAALTVGVVLGLRWSGLGRPVDAAPQETGSGSPLLFRDWGKPDFVLLLSGQMHGYVLPCGCSRPQYGGLERRYNFLKTLEQRGWPVVALDLGDVPQNVAPAKLPNIQGPIKYAYSMRSLKAMGYAAVGLGEYEATPSLEETLGAYSAQSFPPPPPPVLAGNLDTEKSGLLKDAVARWRIADVPGTKLKVGVVGVVSPEVADKIKDQNARFESVPKTLPGLVKGMLAEGKPDLQVLLYQGPLEMAKKCAENFPNFNVVLCVSAEDEPPARPEWVGKTMLVNVGHKGKNVGVVGCFLKNGKAANGFELRYQMVRLGEEYVTPEGQEKGHPVLEKMEAYTQELKDKDYLSKYPQVKHPLVGQAVQQGLGVPTFAGSDRCAKCHDTAHKIWEHTPHAHAYQTLVDSKKPSLREYDAECIVCHVVGFGYTGGFTGFAGLDPDKDKEKFKRQQSLMNVGCESCHGPCSEHARMPEDPKWRKLINPFKFDADVAEKAKKGDAAAVLAEKKRISNLDRFCQNCHDTDNDVHWDFNLNWPKIEHHTPVP